MMAKLDYPFTQEQAVAAYDEWGCNEVQAGKSSEHNQ